MCHPEVPDGAVAHEVAREEVAIPLGGEESMPALLASPAGGSGPGVVVVCDIFGRSPFYEALGARLATAGFVALVPDYFFRLGSLPEQTREAAFARRARLSEPLALRDLGAAIGWMRARSPGGRTGTVGFCMGGTFVLDLAAEHAGLATVCYYGFPAGSAGLAGELRAPSPLERAGDVEGPILGFWGALDEAVGMHNVDALAKALADRGVELEHEVYPGVGHGFLRALDDPADAAHAPACDSWTRALAFYRARL